MEVSAMMFAGVTAATVCRLQPECQQLSLLCPAPRPLHLCPSLSTPQTGPTFQRDGLGILGMPPVETRATGAAWSLGRPEGELRGPFRPTLGSRRTQGPTRTPRNDDIPGEEVGSQQAHLPGHHSAVLAHTYQVPGVGYMLDPFRGKPSP